MKKTYEIIQRRDQKGIKCLICGLTSYNINDVKNKYCGNCHQFHENRPPEKNIILEKIGMTRNELLATLTGIKFFIQETFKVNSSLILFDEQDQKLVALYSDAKIDIQISIFKHIIKRFETCYKCEHKESCKAFKIQDMSIKKHCDE